MKYLRTLIAMSAFLLLVVPSVSFASADSVPSPPLDLQCRVGESYVDLFWKAPMDDGGNVSYYLVYRGSSSEDMEVIANISANQTAYHDGGLEVGTSHYYLVTAVNGAGESSVSNAVAATTESTTIIKMTPSSDTIFVSILALILAIVAIQIAIVAIWVMVKKAFK